MVRRQPMKTTPSRLCDCSWCGRRMGGRTRLAGWGDVLRWRSDLDMMAWRNLVMGRPQKYASSAVDSKPLIRNVADTACWVAFYRALETERSDALFRDPYARMLAGERGERIVAALGGPRRGQLLFTTRTVLMDQLVCGEIAKGAVS